MRVGLIGSVGSSLLTLQKLVEYSFNVVGVWGYEPHSTLTVCKDVKNSLPNSLLSKEIFSDMI